MIEGKIKKLKIPRTVYDEIEIQNCPICGSEELGMETFNYYEFAHMNGIELEDNDSAYVQTLFFVSCKNCGLRVQARFWNKLKLEKEN